MLRFVLSKGDSTLKEYILFYNFLQENYYLQNSCVNTEKYVHSIFLILPSLITQDLYIAARQTRSATCLEYPNWNESLINFI